MAKFSKCQPLTTYEGANASPKNALCEWQNMLFSWFVEPGYYESSKEMQSRFLELTDKAISTLGPEKVSHICWYARNVLGMRSASCLVAAKLNSHKFEGKRIFYRRYFHRADDVSELFSAIDMLGHKRSHAMVRGACGYINSLTEYEVSKYRMQGKKYSMMDVVNIVHAKGCNEAVSKLKTGDLQIAKTWENTMFLCETPEQKSEQWAHLVKTGSLGVMALLRNIRNIVEFAFNQLSVEDVRTCICKILENEESVRKSLAMPYRIYMAHKAAEEVGIEQGLVDAKWRGSCVHCTSEHAKSEKLSMVLCSLEKAFKSSCSNVPILNGKTAVVMDVSASMQTTFSEYSQMTPAQAGCLFCASLLLSNPACDVYAFATKAKLCNYDFQDKNPFKFWEYALSLCLGFGTNLDSAFELIDSKYDRIVLISDMQCAKSSVENSKLYKYLENNPECKVYSFDLGNYHSEVETPLKNIAYITALNSSAFDLINLMESDQSIFDMATDKYMKGIK